MSDRFDISSYWEKRYLDGKTSGSGSYGRLADYKASFLNAFVAQNSVRTVMEFGSGDGNQLKLARYPNYIGFDLSDTAVQKCRSIFKDDQTKSFFLNDQYTDQRAELVLSLDVIYHLVNDDDYDVYMRRIFAASTQYVIIYASDDATMSDVNRHVLHRNFTSWVKKSVNFRLIENPRSPFHVRNKPSDGMNSEFSPSEFYVYARRRRRLSDVLAEWAGKFINRSKA